MELFSCDAFFPFSLFETISITENIVLVGAYMLPVVLAQEAVRYVGTDDYNWILKNIVMEYDDIDKYSDGLARVEFDGKYGFINRDAEVVIPLVYDWALRYSEGLALVMQQQKTGFIDTDGAVAIPMRYSGGHSFSEGYAAVCLNGKYGFIDKKGCAVTPFKYDEVVKSFSQGLALVAMHCDAAESGGTVSSSKRYGYVDTAGREVVPVEYLSLGLFSEGLAFARKNDVGQKFGFIDTGGNVVIPFDYHLVGSGFSEGLAAVGIDGKWGYIDKVGKNVIPFEYDYAAAFGDGLALVGKGDDFFYIDARGEFVRDYDEAANDVHVPDWMD